jgi:hypothetical protein
LAREYPNLVLSKEHLEIVYAWLSKKWTRSRGCDICGHEAWTVPDYLVAPPVFKNSSLIIGDSPLSPQVMIVCAYCGNTKYMNAVLMGLAEPIKPEVLESGK